MYKVVTLALVLALGAPASLSAAWWNIKTGKVTRPTPPPVEKPVETPATSTTTDPVDTTINSDWEKKLEALTKENVDLKKKVSSYQKEINSCKLDLKAKTVALSTAAKEYSDYKFKYSWDGKMMKFTSPTSRKLSIRAIKFELKDTPTTISAFSSEEFLDEAYLLIGTKRYELERYDRTFKYTGGPINIDNATIIIVIVRGGSGDTYFTNPVKSEWILWDETNDKQVKID